MQGFTKILDIRTVDLKCCFVCRANPFLVPDIAVMSTLFMDATPIGLLSPSLCGHDRGIHFMLRMGEWDCLTYLIIDKRFVSRLPIIQIHRHHRILTHGFDILCLPRGILLGWEYIGHLNVYGNFKVKKVLVD